MMTIVTYFFVIACLVINKNIVAQNVIYSVSGAKAGLITEVTDEKIKFQNPLNPGPIYSVSTSKVSLAFKNDGSFIIISKLNENPNSKEKFINNFLKEGFGQKREIDEIYTIDNNKVLGNITLDDASFITVKVKLMEVKLDKKDISVIIYKNGEHKIFTDPKIAANTLWAVQQEENKNKLTSTSNSGIKSFTQSEDKEEVKQMSSKTVIQNKISDEGKMHAQAAAIAKAEVDNKAKEEALAIAFAKTEAAKKAKEEAITIALAKTEAAKKEREEAIALKADQKKLKLQLIKELQDSIRERQLELITAKTALYKDSADIKIGEKDIDSLTYELYSNYRNVLGYYKAQLNKIEKIATDQDEKQQINLFKKVLNKEDAKYQSSITYIDRMTSGKIPMSSNLETVVKSSRVKDLYFFVPEAEISLKQLNGESLLHYAIRQNADTAFINYLIQKGAQLNSYGKRLVENEQVYSTPLVLACMQGNQLVIENLIKSGAKFYPQSATNKEKRAQLSFVTQQLKSKPEIINQLKSLGFNIEDGAEKMKEVINEITTNMVRIDSASFLMGCKLDPRYECVEAEKPATMLKVESFSLGKYEVTNKQWQAIMEDYDVLADRSCANCPVSFVSYNQVLVFINKLNELTGKKFRLPTEAEWEFAAKGGANYETELKFSGSNDVNEVSWHESNSGGKTHPVGEKKANQLGIFDLSGNVSEWCEDWFIENYYKIRKDLTTKGPETGIKKVIRGGDFKQIDYASRVSRRYGGTVTMMSNQIGFRLALSE